jgi:hypothetical protein
VCLVPSARVVRSRANERQTEPRLRCHWGPRGEACCPRLARSRLGRRPTLIAGAIVTGVAITTFALASRGGPATATISTGATATAAVVRTTLASQEQVAGTLERACTYTLVSQQSVNDEFDWATAIAIEQWQRAHGVAQTGVIPLGTIAFLPGAVRVTAQLALPGTPAQPGAQVLGLSSTDLAVNVPLDPSRPPGR